MRGENSSKWAVIVFALLACLLLLMDAAEATQVLTLRKHAGDGGSMWNKRSGTGGYDEWRRSVGIVCNGEGAASSSSASSNLRCLPWKFP